MPPMIRATADTSPRQPPIWPTNICWRVASGIRPLCMAAMGVAVEMVLTYSSVMPSTGRFTLGAAQVVIRVG